MAESFRFLSTPEFERLTHAQKLTYLSDAMEELERAKVPRQVRDWDILFKRPTEGSHAE